MTRGSSNQVCDTCGKSYPKSTEYFRKYARKTNGLNWHPTCRFCEDKAKSNEEWKDGKLLCHVCKEYKDPEEFTNAGGNKYPLRDHKDGRCNKCKNQQRKDKVKTYNEDEKLSYIITHRWNGAKDRAVKKGIEFSITKEDILDLWNRQEDKCALSGLPMTYIIEEGRTFSNLSIDQIEPSKGYTKDNIQLVCMAVNQLKSDFDLETIYMLCEALLNNKSNLNYV